MKKRLHEILFCSLCCAMFAAALPLTAQEGEDHYRRTCRRGEACIWSYRDATVLSMMGWGIGLAAGIALLAGMLNQSTSTSH